MTRATESRRTGLYRNTVSYFGALVGAASILLIIFTLALGWSLKRPSPYMGIFTYLLFPALFTVGAMVFLYGMRRESRRRRRAGSDEALPYPRLDLNDPAQRRWFSYFVLGGTALAVLIAFVTYNAFLYTESVSFCGTLCHKVMQPEYQAYLASPHARVRCVDCHVGAGASWYVKSKLSGARQVVAVLSNSYPRPIPTPIANLRPARETCEECHWPAKFYGTQMLQNPHFRFDEKNTPEQISLGVKTGGGSAALGGTAGIHWHMIIEQQVSYVAVDRRKQVIPKIFVVGPGSRREEFVSLDYQGPKEQLDRLPRDVMDCMDCHNRPTHIFLPPETAVDRAMTTDLIPPTLPWAKKVVVDALVREYPDSAKAHAGLRADIEGFYRKRYPELAKRRAADVEQAVVNAVAIYDRSVFPQMRVNWRTYPTNIGHRDWPGCFRCHDGRHVSPAGKVLTMQCTTCHTEPVRSALEPLGTIVTASKLPWHPVDLSGKHSRIQCTRCHAAGYRPTAECAGCHRLDTRAPMMGSLQCADCHLKKTETKPLGSCKDCHDPLPGLHLKGGHPGAACTKCHRPHRWVVTGRDTCLACHDGLKAHEPGKACMTCHAFGAKPKPPASAPAPR